MIFLKNLLINEFIFYWFIFHMIVCFVFLSHFILSVLLRLGTKPNHILMSHRYCPGLLLFYFQVFPPIFFLIFPYSIRRTVLSNYKRKFISLYTSFQKNRFLYNTLPPSYPRTILPSSSFESFYVSQKNYVILCMLYRKLVGYSVFPPFWVVRA